MNILLTNDDGIESEGLRVLAEWAKTLGEVYIAAPKTQQSATSHAVNLVSDYEVKEVSYMPGVWAWTVDAPPADCIRVAEAALKVPADLVFSGINKGLNVGWDILYSGTCGAIFEAATYGLPGVAFSTDFYGFTNAAAHLDEVWQYIVKHGLFRYSRLLNVNIPDEGCRGIRITRQGGPFYRDDFTFLPENRCRAVGYVAYNGGSDLKLDLDAVMNHYISVSPLSVCRTDLPAYEAMRRDIEREEQP